MNRLIAKEVKPRNWDDKLFDCIFKHNYDKYLYSARICHTLKKTKQ